MHENREIIIGPVKGIQMARSVDLEIREKSQTAGVVSALNERGEMDDGYLILSNGLIEKIHSEPVEVTS